MLGMYHTDGVLTRLASKLKQLAEQYDAREEVG